LTSSGVVYPWSLIDPWGRSWPLKV
jgi:hypothetical protein